MALHPPPIPSPSPTRAALVRFAPAGQDTRARQRNHQWLEAYAASSDDGERLRWRNALVGANLPLVASIAGRQSRTGTIPFEDLVQVGSMGLIRAVEAFDPSRSVSLSSFAVPFIRGAMQHELRDRQSLMRAPRPLWELRQRAAALQEQRRRLGQPPLADGPLADRLGCRTPRLQEALALRELTSPRSLDAPVPREGTGVEAGSLLDQLADPASTVAETPEPEPAALGSPELHWLRERLRMMEPVERSLLEGRLVQGCTWVELGTTLGMSPRQAQRRCETALGRLRREAGAWRQGAMAATAPATVNPTVGGDGAG